MTEPSPAQALDAFAANYRALEQRVIAAEEEARDARSDATHLLNEVNMLRAQLAESETERRRLDNYSRDLTTRLTVIGEAVVGAVQEARKYAMREVVPATDTSRGPALTAEQHDNLMKVLGTELSGQGAPPSEPPPNSGSTLPQNRY